MIEFIFLACGVAIYFYVEHKQSFGGFWTVFYLGLIYLIEAFTEVSLAIASITTAIVIIAAFEFVRRFWEDPFSDANIYQLARRALPRIKALLYLVGLRPKNPILDYGKDRQVAGLRKLLSSGGYDAAESRLFGLSDNTRYMILTNIGDSGRRPTYIDDWLKSRPDSALALACSGLNWINLAWDARGGGLGSTVSMAAAEQFYICLARADDDLSRSIAINKNLPEPYIGLITIAMGSGATSGELWKFFASVIRVSPHHYYAHTQMINATAEKWGGSSEEMFKVARQASFSSERGSPLKGTIALAHIEQWLSLEMQEREAEAAQYFFDKQVQSEVKDAYREFGDAEVESIEQVEAFNYFIYCFHLAGLYSEFSDALLRLQGRYTQMPWAYHGQPMLCMLDTGYSVDHVVASS